MLPLQRARALRDSTWPQTQTRRNRDLEGARWGECDNAAVTSISTDEVLFDRTDRTTGGRIDECAVVRCVGGG